MVEINKATLLIGAAAAITSVLFYVLYKQSSNQTKSLPAINKTEDDIREIPNLQKDQLLSILDAISAQMGSIVMQLAKLEAKIRQESTQNGRSLPEDQLASYLMGQFEEAMKTVETQVYTKFQTTEDEVKIATEFYEEEQDQDVTKAVTKLQELYMVMTGGSITDAEVPADFTLDKFIAVMQETMERLNVAMEEVCQEVKKLAPSNKEEMINQLYVQRAEDLSAEIHAQHGLNREMLQAAMLKYQQEPAFLMAMTELQQEQAERFAAAASIFDEAQGLVGA